MENESRSLYLNSVVNVENGKALTLLKLQSGLEHHVLPGVEAIGAGYNPFLSYASANSITVQLFDWRNAATSPVSFNDKYVVPTIVDVQQNDRSAYKIASGSSINKYQEDISSGTEVSGKYNFFSGSIRTELNSQSIHNASNEFSRVQQSISLWSLSLPITPTLRDYLIPDFRKYLDELPLTNEAAAELFRTRGSHFLTGIVMGGRAVYTSATDKLQVERSHELKITAKASYEDLTGQLSAENKTKYSESISSFRELSESSYYIVGGDGVKAAAAFNGPNEFNSWRDSVGDFPNFIDFISTIPMEGIWALCATQKQSVFLKDYFYNVWGPAQSKALQLYADYIDKLIVISDKKSTIKPPIGYKKIPYNLNSKAGGDYIYLCYHSLEHHSVQENKKCITELRIIYGKNTNTPTGFNRLPQDLNKGADGQHIYLCYKEMPYSDKEAIKGITVIGGKNELISPPYDYIKVEGDLNKGAGGEFVYVCTSTLS